LKQTHEKVKAGKEESKSCERGKVIRIERSSKECNPLSVCWNKPEDNHSLKLASQRSIIGRVGLKYAIVISFVILSLSFPTAKKFKIITAEKPLILMFNKANIKLPPRIETWVMDMQDVDLEIIYEPGKDEADEH
jgi:hypothetical protein